MQRCISWKPRPSGRGDSPRSLFKEYKSFTKYPENKSVLTHRAHLIAHYLLAKAIGGTMWYAYNNMNAHKVRLSTRLYESAQKNVSELQSARTKEWLKNNDHPAGMKNKKHSEETKKRIGESGKGRLHTEEVKVALSEKWYGRTEAEKQHIVEKISLGKIGQTHNAETKKLISDKAKLRYDSGFKITLTEEQLKKSKEAQKEYFKNNNHHTKGKSYDDIMGKEKADELRKLRSDQNPMKKQEYRDKISKANKGKKKSDETKYKLSLLVPITNGKENKRIDPSLLNEYLENGWWKGLTKQPEEKVTCPHCGIESNKGNINRWHMNNCKLRKIVI